MFEGKLCKKAALAQLKGRWKNPVLLTLITGIILILLSLPGSLIESYVHPSPAEEQAGFIANLIFYVVQSVFSFAGCVYALTFARTPGPVNFNPFFRGLESWFKALRGTLWYGLWVFLWSLLFVIPGIIKAISYSQMFFILADHPKTGVIKAMKISKIMTAGHKADLFILHLSFLGWVILCVLTAFIGFLWLVPYERLTFTNAYRDLQNRALKSGALSPSDFE